MWMFSAFGVASAVTIGMFMHEHPTYSIQQESADTWITISLYGDDASVWLGLDCGMEPEDFMPPMSKPLMTWAYVFCNPTRLLIAVVAVPILLNYKRHLAVVLLTVIDMVSTACV